MELKPHACLECPAYYKNDRNFMTTRGTMACEIDGKKVRIHILRQTYDSRGRVLKPFCLYCLAKMPNARMIGHLTTWTGKVPNWCPRVNGTLEECKED